MKKKKSKKVDVPVSAKVWGALSPPDLQKAIEEEYEMQLQDKVIEETKEKKNAVESYVYSMRNKVRAASYTDGSQLMRGLTGSGSRIPDRGNSQSLW